MPGTPPVVPFVLAAAGVGLVLAAYANTSPLGQLRAVLSGNGKAAPIDTHAGGLTDPLDRSQPFAGSALVGQATFNEPPGLQSIGQGGHRLRADAAIGFTAWQAAFGAPIIVTDSYRSYAVQKAGYERDPSRFAPPDKSEHVKGTAVDVNLGAVGAVPPSGNSPGNSAWQHLYATATATGWHNPRGPYQGDHKEPWHFSRGGG